MSDKYDLSRRKALLGLGTIGVASAGAGVGTSAYFNDTEELNSNTLSAGKLDLIVHYHTSVYQGQATGHTDSTTKSGTVDKQPVSHEYEINDLKPGDSGKLRFCPKVTSNPAWVWIGSLNGVTDHENGLSGPEHEIDNKKDGGELSEAIKITDIYYCRKDGKKKKNMDAILDTSGDYTLADLMDTLQNGVLLDSDTGHDKDPYPAGEKNCLCIKWKVPTHVGNEIQSDGVTFDIAFSAIQDRHNENPQDPFEA